MRTENGNSIAYPGEKKVTCKLQLPVVGNKEGAYQFQVQITPSVTAGNQSVFATTAALSLGATKLYSTPKDDKVYDYPESGDLAISFPVTGNPVPKTVTLWVRHSNTEMAPVSSGNFRWTYDKQAGTNFGHVKVFVLKTALGENVVRNYTLKVDNGVIGLSEFEYNFAVMGNMEPPTVPICDSPVFINGGATAKISCTSDRLAPSFKWEFTLTSESGHLQDWSKEERCQVEDSTAYPGLKKSICGLQVSVIGSSAGDYRFKVKITSILDAQEGNVLSAEKLTPVVSLNPTTLLNFEDNNHIFKYPQSGQLAIDVYVKGNPEPTNVRLWVRQSDASGTVPVSSQNFRWTYQKTAGAVQSGVIQLTISGGLEDGEISSYTLKAENGVVSESEFEYKFSVNGMDIEAAAAVSEKQNNLPVIAGSAAGGLVLLLIIIVMIIFVLRKRRNVQNSGSDYNTAQHIGEFDSPYIYPNKGFSPDGGNREEESQYSKLPSPYLVPMPERPMSNYSLPEYSEIYDTPKKDNQQD
ncbi:hypothetical protein RRG08_051315 [Elysia crispata]|uniref:Uncharacterized protein n=1 Tax=Elysia crispata TaxID=231223 RepID=A0AAE0ZI82_9GAST|nr:hypothetical protein RRG08_051315 [Elysia crispata]